jgi:hypothetical protein
MSGPPLRHERLPGPARQLKKGPMVALWPPWPTKSPPRLLPIPDSNVISQFPNATLFPTLHPTPHIALLLTSSLSAPPHPQQASHILLILLALHHQHSRRQACPQRGRPPPRARDSSTRARPTPTIYISTCTRALTLLGANNINHNRYNKAIIPLYYLVYLLWRYSRQVLTNR